MSDKYLLYKSSIPYIILSILLYLIFLLPANLDLISSSNQLFMDEQISFDETSKIIHFQNFFDLFQNIIIGDQRYGRIIYLISAVFAYLPSKLYGDSGIIVTIRMLFFFSLVISYYILIKTFLNNSFLSVITFVCLICIPTTSYYSTIPKPEPLLILFLSIFLFYFSGNKGFFGKYFIFLGLAFGCKISITILVIFIFFLSFIIEFKRNKSEQTKRNLYFKFLISVLFFTFGWFIAVPIIPFSIIQPSFSSGPSYLGSTFLSTSHGADDSTVNAIIWIKSIAYDWVQAPLYLIVTMSKI